MLGGWLARPEEGSPVILEECETPETPQDVARVVQDSYNEALHLLNTNEWHQLSFADERVYLGELTIENSPIKCIRVSTILDGSPQEVFKFFSNDDPKQRAKWDPDMIELQIVERFPEIKAEIIFQAYKAPFPVTSRSFVATRAVRTLEDGTIISFGTSVNHRDCTYNSNYVRGVATSGSYYRPVPGEPYKCELIRIVKLDPKGNIPSSVVNAGISKAAKSMTKFIQLIKDESQYWDRRPAQVVPPPQPEQIPEPVLKEKPVPQLPEAHHEAHRDEFVSDSEDDQFYETSTVIDTNFLGLDSAFREIESKINASALQTQTTLQALTKQQERLQQQISQLEKTQTRLVQSRATGSALPSTTLAFLVVWPVVVVGAYEVYKRYLKK